MVNELSDLIRYNRWANERILAACVPLSAHELVRDLGGSFPSVWATLTHIYGAETSWLARWQGTPAGQRPDLEDVTDIPSLQTKWTPLADEQAAWLATQSTDDLRRVIGVHLWSGAKFDQQLGGTVRHCMNHSTYHRGQVTNFLRMLGATAVGTDLVTYYREFPSVVAHDEHYLSGQP